MFSSYGAMFSEKTGLCRVYGVTDAIKTNGFGSAVTEKVSDIQAQLTAKYGEGRKFDYVRAGSLWDEPQDWMMGLVKQDRSLAVFWGTEDKPVSATIESIKLDATAENSSEAEIRLSYDFENMDDCVAEIKAQDDAAL